MKKGKEWKIKVYAVNNDKVWGRFDIYLSMPDGKREWLMSHVHQGVLFQLLKNGISLAELKTVKGFRKDLVKHLLRVVDEYLAEGAAS